MEIYISLLVCIVGLLVWALASNGLVKDAGRIAYGCGLLAFLLTSDRIFNVVSK